MRLNTYPIQAWPVMKELSEKVKLKLLNLPQEVTVNKIDLLDETKIVHELNFSLQIQEKTWRGI